MAKNEQYYSAAIGASMSTLTEAGAYGAFANGGTYYKPTYIRKITTADGLTTNYGSTGKRAMSGYTAYMITDMLKGVLTKGTGTSGAISGLYAAAKTGTTDYSDTVMAENPTLKYEDAVKDSWFTGYTKQRVVSVWTGYDQSSKNGVTPSEEKKLRRTSTST